MPITFIHKAEAFLESIRAEAEPLEKATSEALNSSLSACVECSQRIRQKPPTLWMQLRCFEDPPIAVRDVLWCTVALIAVVRSDQKIKTHEVHSDPLNGWHWDTRLLSSPQLFVSMIVTFSCSIDE